MKKTRGKIPPMKTENQKESDKKGCGRNHIDDYGLCMNMADAIDSQRKLENSKRWMSEGRWMKFISRYRI